jgi:hypothetical protein
MAYCRQIGKTYIGDQFGQDIAEKTGFNILKT